MLEFIAAARSDVGDLRQINQDSILCRAEYGGLCPVGLFAVADGCGGLAHGEKISRLATAHLEHLWETELREMAAGKDLDDEALGRYLDRAIQDINAAALDFGRQAGEQVGTTLSLLLLRGSRYLIKNVGDSRVYLAGKGRIIRLTEDQSLVADMIRNKELTPEEAENFGKKNVLTMCVGLFPEIKIYSNTGRTRPGDLFLLASDGLYNAVPAAPFRRILLGPGGLPERRAQGLREAIPPGEARDNVSLALVRVKRTKRSVRRMILLFVLPALIVLFFVLRLIVLDFLEDMFPGPMIPPGL